MSDVGQKLYTADELIALDVPETNFYLEPFIPTDGIVMLFGKPSTYKTTLVYAMAQAIATGGQLWATTPDITCPVLILELDSPLSVIKTRFAPGLTLGSKVHTYFHHGTLDLVNRKTAFESQVWGELRAAHEKHRYGVIFVDTLQRVLVGDPNQAELVGPTYSAFQQLFPGSVIAFIHHGRKSGKDDTPEMKMESFLGSQQWCAQAQVVIRADVGDRSRGIIELTVVKSQVAEMSKPLRLQITGWKVELEGAVKLREASEILSAMPGDLSKREMDLRLAKELGVSERTARNRRRAWEKGIGSFGQLVPFSTCPPQVVEGA